MHTIQATGDEFSAFDSPVAEASQDDDGSTQQNAQVEQGIHSLEDMGTDKFHLLDRVK